MQNVLKRENVAKNIHLGLVVSYRSKEIQNNLQRREHLPRDLLHIENYKENAKFFVGVRKKKRFLSYVGGGGLRACLQLLGFFSLRQVLSILFILYFF